MNNEIKMLGCTEVQLEQQFARQYNINMYLAGLLSDAQHLIEAGRNDQAVQIINQVKHYFFEHTDTRGEVNTFTTKVAA